ncbi:precorrin-2 dehydrogenase/sirohydrochlorin ferrochelatase family protein [Desulfopila aestuarii]|uniref:precorrin-2 dehydrogenase n=1 Tax=Desulfopila aestuarii DSM 18488 TaxID=1121416 RepID=A0A1M7YAQ6_9BACT|nr:bifunctional precorrin-2 dehydrogenase/sirohydrochlorin ferrochelatase [Desulfopila aestuarii]SHO49713.1 precorrin-2 dehydrogenase [Desulfopila aestuarii DSM 18488]
MMLYPVNLQIAGKLCLVIGGGKVGLRKIRTLLSCGARVMVISPEVVEGIALLVTKGEIELQQRGYREGDLAGAFLAFAVTNNRRIQDQVATEARKNGVFLNIADEPTRCDFQVPAQVRRGELLLTVSTGGASPALAKLIREQLEEQFDGEYGKVISLFARIRDVIVDRPGNSEVNRVMFQRLLQAGLVDLVRGSKWELVAALLRSELPEGIDVDALIGAVSS